MVNGVRIKRKENAFMHNFRRFGYWAINSLSDSEIPQNVGDFRLIDRSVVEQLKKSKNTNSISLKILKPGIYLIDATNLEGKQKIKKININ